jgi:hypothetical protein
VIAPVSGRVKVESTGGVGGELRGIHLYGVIIELDDNKVRKIGHVFHGFKGFSRILLPEKSKEIRGTPI